MREIITIQCGTQANYVATHFWNAQESYFTWGDQPESLVDHDISFRAGIGADGLETYTPRTLIYDAKESFGSQRIVNELYELPNQDFARSSGISTVIQQPRIPVHPYQNHVADPSVDPQIDAGNVRFFSDYSRLFYHPQSSIPLDVHALNPGFPNYAAGEELFENEDAANDVFDRDFRPFAEDSDHMQGVVMIVDDEDAWGGFAASYLERLRDRMGRTTIAVFSVNGLYNSRYQLNSAHIRSVRLANSVQSLISMVAHASIYIPLATTPLKRPSYLTIDQNASQWQTSAMQMAAIESVTLPSRLKTTSSGNGSLGELQDFFNFGHRTILRTELQVNDREQSQANGVNGVNGDHRARPSSSLLTNDRPALDMILMPSASARTHDSAIKRHVFSRLDVVRERENTSGSEVTRSHTGSDPAVQSFVSQQVLPRLTSFPAIFDAPAAFDSGYSVQATLSADSNVASFLRERSVQAPRLLPLEEREEASHMLKSWAEEYISGWESGSDEDSDD